MSFLSDGNLQLRALEPQDIEIVYRMENDAALWDCSETSVPYSRYAIKRFLEENTGDIYADKQVRLVAERVTDHVPVGFADLTGFSVRHMRVETGILVFPAFRKAGNGRAILSLLEKYAGEQLLLHCIFAIVAENNMPAMRLFARAGYANKGILDEWLVSKDGFSNAVVFQKLLSQNL